MPIFAYGMENSKNKDRSLIEKWWKLNEIGKCLHCNEIGRRNLESQFDNLLCIEHRNGLHGKTVCIEAENEEQAQEELDAILVVNAL